MNSSPVLIQKICPTKQFGSSGDDSDEEAHWFPEGGKRDHVTTALERFEAPGLAWLPSCKCVVLQNLLMRR